MPPQTRFVIGLPQAGCSGSATCSHSELLASDNVPSHQATTHLQDSEFQHDKIGFPMSIIPRRKTLTAVVGNVRVGSDAPIVVQSMTNTDTADILATVQQCAALARAGSELVRV